MPGRRRRNCGPDSRSAQYVSSRPAATVYGTLAISPFEGMSLAIGLAGEPEAHCDIPDVMGWSAQQLTEADQHLAGLDRCLERVGMNRFTLRAESGCPVPGCREKQRIKAACDGAIARSAGFSMRPAFCRRCSAFPRLHRAECEEQHGTARTLVDAPASVAEVVCGTAALGCETDSRGRLSHNETPWDVSNAELNEWLQFGKRRQDLKTSWQALFVPAAEEEEWSDLLVRRRAACVIPAVFQTVVVLGREATQSRDESQSLPPNGEELQPLAALIESGTL